MSIIFLWKDNQDR